MPPPDDHPELGPKIRLLRKQLGFSQEHVAQVARVSVKAYQRVERDESSPSIRTLLAIARALGTKASVLLAGIPPDPDDELR